MQRRFTTSTLLLLTTTLVSPGAFAQSTGGAAPATQSPPATSTPNSTASGSATGDSPIEAQADQAPDSTTTPGGADEGQAEEPIEVSTPGADPTGGEGIVVTGRNIPNVVRSTPQVVSVLSTADIARTGEGDIAGALTRVTGLSVVGNGFVFVRGLGDRYSSSLLNGSPLPSPEPLRRSVPLDIFPTTIVGSALVQKTYSVNYPGEFGGGVINLTTKAIPRENFISIGGSVAADDITSSELGYVYDGGDTDWLGFDDGTRGVPDFIRNAPNTGIIPTAQVAQLTNAETTLLQRNNHIPFNFSGEISGGSVFDMGDNRLGLIASLSLSNTWRTRVTTQQDATDLAGSLRNNYQTLITDNRVVANALIGVGYEFGDNTIRWTNVYIHDTLKQARGGVGLGYVNAETIVGTDGTEIIAPRFQQNTNWFERQLFESQLVGEFRLTDTIKLDARGAYANSKRKSPYERQFDYFCQQRFQAGGVVYTASVTDPNGSAGVQCPGAYAINNRAAPTIVFSDLNEDLYSGQADLTYEVGADRPMTLSAGYFFSKADRVSTRLDFRYIDNNGSVPQFPASLLRPDYLLSDDILFNSCPFTGTGACNLQLQFNPGIGTYQYDAGLTIHAGYVQAEAEAMDGLRAVVGVRYENGKEEVTPIGAASIRLNNDYFLPAGTLTWNFAENMQLRASASKTISRPQFRELAPQQFRDPDSDRLFFGNPNLIDSELYNLEARYEWFFGRDQRVTVAGFYKRIDNPIEQVGFYTGQDDRLQTGFTYLPKAKLYGAEFEIQKYFDLSQMGGFFESRRLLAIANYTYTKSEITANNECVPNPAAAAGSPGLNGCASGFGPASVLFRDGASLTGQSDHLVNLQLGIDDTDRLSQLTVLFNYASERVTNRGPLVGGGFQPDVIEVPGIRLDVVARQGFEVGGGTWELKLEARNLTRTDFKERQIFPNDVVVYANRYRQGRIFSAGLSTSF